jgi:hypothetical protein
MVRLEGHRSHDNMIESLRPRLSQVRRFGSAILAFAAGISCGQLTDPPLPIDAELFVPPPVYATWWKMVESCSGFHGSLDQIQWYATAGPLRDPQNSDDPIVGYWSRASNRIVLVRDDTVEGAVVRHEMLHALVRSSGHPRSAFLENCGGVVSCPSRCVRDGGSPPPIDASTPSVASSDLEVTSAVSPASPSSVIDGGFGTFTISVHNPFQHPVVVVLPPSGSVGTSYRYTIRQISGGGVGSGDPAIDPGLTYFAAGETKRGVIDFLVVAIASPSVGAIQGLGPNGIALPPGPYSFGGDFGGHSAADLTVVLSR